MTLDVTADGQAEVVMRECNGNGLKCGKQLNAQVVKGAKGQKQHNADAEAYTPTWTDVDFTLEVSDTTQFSIASACFRISEGENTQKVCIR
jgi:hypothetical protein